MQNRIVNRIELKLIVNNLKSNRSEFAKIVLESNRKPMNRESNRFAVYPKIHSPSEQLDLRKSLLFMGI